jgi:hypothetical protein
MGLWDFEAERGRLGGGKPRPYLLNGVDDANWAVPPQQSQVDFPTLFRDESPL